MVEVEIGLATFELACGVGSVDAFGVGFGEFFARAGIAFWADFIEAFLVGAEDFLAVGLRVVAEVAVPRAFFRPTKEAVREGFVLVAIRCDQLALPSEISLSSSASLRLLSRSSITLPETSTFTRDSTGA